MDSKVEALEVELRDATKSANAINTKLAKLASERFGGAQADVKSEVEAFEVELRDGTKSVEACKAISTKLADLASEKYGGAQRKACPSLSRDTGAGILQLIADAKEPIPIQESLDFIADGVYNTFAFDMMLKPSKMKVYEYSYQKNENFKSLTSSQQMPAKPNYRRSAETEFPYSDSSQKTQKPDKRRPTTST